MSGTNSEIVKEDEVPLLPVSASDCSQQGAEKRAERSRRKIEVPRAVKIAVAAMIAASLLLLLAPLGWSPCAAGAPGVGPSPLLSSLTSTNSSHSGDISSCSGKPGPNNSPSAHAVAYRTRTGYTVDSVQSTDSGGLIASLSQAGKACNAFGNDISSLTLSVEYESSNRLHVHIYDTAQTQYQLPDSVFARPGGTDRKGASDLVFNYTSSPFEFWVARSSGEVLFDTRSANIPKRPDQAVIEGKEDNKTVLPGYPLIFEDQYLQIASALPTGANIYGLGEVLVRFLGSDQPMLTNPGLYWLQEE